MSADTTTIGRSLDQVDRHERDLGGLARLGYPPDRRHFNVPEPPPIGAARAM